MSDSLQLLVDLIASARKAGASAADAVMYETTDISVSQRMGKPEGIERAESSCVGLRLFIGQKQAIASSTDSSKQSLMELVERVAAMAKVAPEDTYSTLAPEALLAKNIPGLDLYDPEEPSTEWLLAQCKVAEDSALAVQGITNSEGADASYGANRLSLATSHGFAQSYQTSHMGISVSVLAGEGVGMERDYDYTSARHRADLQAPEIVGKSAAERALKRMNPRKVATCNVPIVFDPRVARSLLGSCASAISGASVARGTSFLKDKLGQAIFSKGVYLFDDPHLVRGLGSRPFDGEGVMNRKIALIEDGILQSWLLDVRSANRLNLTSTGHASRGLSSPPSPSTSNLYMAAGSLSPKELIADIESGFYVTETFGMGVNIVTGDYSQGASGFWIEKGELAYAVSEVTIAGHLGEMFRTLTPANDLEFRYSTNSPTLRIDKMAVAGV